MRIPPYFTCKGLLPHREPQQDGSQSCYGANKRYGLASSSPSYHSFTTITFRRYKAYVASITYKSDRDIDRALTLRNIRYEVIPRVEVHHLLCSRCPSCFSRFDIIAAQSRGQHSRNNKVKLTYTQSTLPSPQGIRNLIVCC